MPITARSATLALTLFAYGCAQAPTPQYDIGAYEPPARFSSDATGPEALQNSQSFNQEVQPKDTITTAGGNEISTAGATAIAIIGLLILVSMAETGCAGEGCNPPPETGM